MQPVTKASSSALQGHIDSFAPLETIHALFGILASAWLFTVCLGDGMIPSAVPYFVAMYLLVSGSMALVSAVMRKSPVGIFCVVFPVIGALIMLAIGSIVECRTGWLIALPFHSVLFCLSLLWITASTFLLVKTAGKVRKHTLKLLGCGGAKHPMSPQLIEHIQELAYPEDKGD